MEVLAPIPSASDATAISVNPGRFSKRRAACRKERTMSKGVSCGRAMWHPVSADYAAGRPRVSSGSPERGAEKVQLGVRFRGGMGPCKITYDLPTDPEAFPGGAPKWRANSGFSARPSLWSFAGPPRRRRRWCAGPTRRPTPIGPRRPSCGVRTSSAIPSASSRVLRGGGPRRSHGRSARAVDRG